MVEINFVKFFKRLSLFIILLIIHYLFMFLPVLEFFCSILLFLNRSGLRIFKLERLKSMC